MRFAVLRLSTTRASLAATIALAGVLSLTGVAEADHHRPLPTRAQVDAAKARAAQKAGDVATIQARLVVANASLDAASQQAEIAAENYNGAMWRLQQAKAATAKAKAEAAAARAEVAAQRAGIANLVTESYQQGSALDGMNALLGADGPEGVMNRWGAVQSATDSMQARYDQYTALSGLAKLATAKAEKAQQAQAGLATEAAALRDRASAAAISAQQQQVAIAQQRQSLLRELAAAQKISITLATARERGLEQIARQKAAAAAAAAALAKAKQDAQHQNDAANLGDPAGSDGGYGPDGGWDLPGLPAPRSTLADAAKAIQFARAQLGEPYVWAAAGPDAWDCSGLTMMAWRQGGISLPHFAAAQYQLTKHLNVTQLRPGDLVFWGSSPNTIHHVAMYIGNGQIIQAPRTGLNVEISGMYDWLAPNYFGRP